MGKISVKTALSRLDRVRKRIESKMEPEYRRRKSVLAVHAVAKATLPHNFRDDSLNQKDVRRLKDRIRGDIAGGKRFPRAYIRRAGATAHGGAFYDCEQSRTGKLHVTFRGKGQLGRLRFVVPLNNPASAGARYASAASVAAKTGFVQRGRSAVRRKRASKGIVLVRPAVAEKVMKMELSQAGQLMGGWLPAAVKFRSGKVGYFAGFGGSHAGRVIESNKKAKWETWLENSAFSDKHATVSKADMDWTWGLQRFRKSSAVLDRKHREAVAKAVQRAVGSR